MKRINYLLLICGCLVVNIIAYAQNESGVDSTGLPGDNFSLQGALEMFKEAASPEEFEKLINSENNSVNNLDLDGDGNIDYVRVIDKSDKDAHAIILQVAISATETQDIAVIELEKTGSATASLQIIGDEDLYGEPVIIEPSGNEGASNSVGEESNMIARGGPVAPEFSSPASLIVVNVFLWPTVRFIYGPAYKPWASPWRWHSYPVWWRPWRPFAWHVFQPRVYRYHRPFVVVHTQRMAVAHRLYTPIRVSSVTVRTRHSVAINHYRVTRTTRSTISRTGHNSTTHTRSTVARPANNSSTHTRATTPRPASAPTTRTNPTVSRPNNSQSRTSTTVRSTNTRVKVGITKSKKHK
ncbi:MAG: hypothetical protein ABIN89_20145 [Chitinophagaceae bacterium]